MITDKLENIYFYAEIPQIVKDFIKNITSDVPVGKVVLFDENYVNIETYTTKSIDDAKFEAHEKYIDIQILAAGTEDIYYTDKSKLTVNKPYDDLRDIAFYGENVRNYPKVTLNGSNFVMLYPHEAHAPQVCAGNIQSHVKKVVVKIKV